MQKKESAGKAKNSLHIINVVKDMKKIIILFCFFNRKEKTLRCLESLYSQKFDSSRYTVEIIAVDDASNDGTRESIARLYPDVRVITTTGNYYWSKSMNLAMKEAQKCEYDYLLMVNDDVKFYDDMFSVMLAPFVQATDYCGVVGTTVDTSEKKLTYGGKNDESGVIIYPDDSLQCCKLANWNCFMVSRQVVEKVGIIDGKYRHAWGDYDYSYRMNRSGIPIYIAPRMVGECDNNAKTNTYEDRSLSRLQRIKKMHGPKGFCLRSILRYDYRNKGMKTAWKTFMRYVKTLIKIVVCND